MNNPAASTNATIFSSQPKRSSSSVSLGKTASLLVVLNAMNNGCAIRFKRSGNPVYLK